jgi:hypothetical protein
MVTTFNPFILLYVSDFNEAYNSYEEALEQGLLAALKFIKEKYEK